MTENEAMLQLLDFKVNSLQDERDYLRRQLESALRQNETLIDNSFAAPSTKKQKAKKVS